MSKKIRYLILALGFLIFCILAPLLVMYVGGWLYDADDRGFVRTGLLAMETEPKDVQIFLDGLMRRSGSGPVKFLQPKEYDVAIKKDGYFTWSKRLKISAGQVTWANPSFSKIYLFKNSGRKEIISAGADDFAAAGGKIYYISGDRLFFGPDDKPENAESVSLPAAADRILLSKNGDFAALSGNKTLQLFDYNNKKITALTGQAEQPAQIKFSPQNELYTLENQTLYRFRLGQKQQIAKNILAYGFAGDDLYYVKKSSSNELWITNTPSGSGQILASNLPNFSAGDLFITANRQILLLADSSLYGIGSGVEKISDQISDCYFDSGQGIFVFSRGTELDYFDFDKNQIQFITRTQQPISSPRLSFLTGYAFYLTNNGFHGIELDARDRQNQYQFYSGGNLSNLSLDNSASKAWLMEDGKLIYLDLR